MPTNSCPTITWKERNLHNCMSADVLDDLHILHIFLAFGYAPISSSVRVSYSHLAKRGQEVKQEQRLSGNRDRKASVVVAGLCDGEGECDHTLYDPILVGKKYLKVLNASRSKIRTEQFDLKIFDAFFISLFDQTKIRYQNTPPTLGLKSFGLTLLVTCPNYLKAKCLG